MAKSNHNNRAGRILITILGAALILWGTGTVLLGFAGEKAPGVITSIRRQGGERNETIRGRYTYSVGYTFILPDGEKVDASTTKIGGAAYVKADGTSAVFVKYVKGAPFINALEEDTKPSAGKLAEVAAGVFLIAAVNPQKRERQQKKKEKTAFKPKI